MARKGAWWATAVLLLLLAAFLRFHLLEAQSFWNDEGNSARLSERSVALIIEGTASDVHPPLYYLALRGWRELAGETEFGLRALSAFAGVLTVAGTVALARAVTRSRWAVLATAVFVAVNPALVYYSQEARMYALLGLWATLASWLLGVGGRGVGIGMREPKWIWPAYVLVVTAGLYTHYFFPAVLIFHGLVMLATRLFPSAPPPLRPSAPLRPRAPAPLRPFLTWLGASLTALLLYLPWLPIALDQFGSDPVDRSGALDFVRAAVGWMMVGGTVAETAVSAAAWLFVLVVVLTLLNGRWRGAALLMGIIVPLLFMIVTGTMGPEFFKFLVVAAPLVGVLFALAVLPAARRRWAFPLGALLLALWLPQAARSLHNMVTDPAYARADYRGIAARITADAHPNAGVILNAANQWEVFTYYFADETAVYPLPRGRSRPDPAQIDATLREIAGQHERLYAVFWGEAQRDPERLIERWLDAHAFKAVDEWVGDVRFVMYALLPQGATEMETAVDQRFGQQIVLEGFTIPAAAYRPGDVVPVTLFWRAEAPPETRYKVFLHVIPEGGEQPVAQRDSEPGGGLALTTTWVPGERVVDNHGVLLPADLADGRYVVRLGLYDFAHPERRLPVDGGPEDSLTLGEISVRR